MKMIDKIVGVKLIEKWKTNKKYNLIRMLFINCVALVPGGFNIKIYTISHILQKFYYLCCVLLAKKLSRVSVNLSSVWIPSISTKSNLCSPAERHVTRRRGVFRYEVLLKSDEDKEFCQGQTPHRKPTASSKRYFPG